MEKEERERRRERGEIEERKGKKSTRMGWRRLRDGEV